MLPQLKTTRRKPRYIGWSFSNLKEWRACPRRCLETRIEKKWPDEGGNEHLELGKAVHTAMENRILKGDPIPVHLQAYFAANLEGWANKLLGGRPDAAAYKAATGMEIFGEQQLAITEDYKPCEWFDKKENVWARAMVDVTMLGPNKAVLFDWKTGKVNEREKDQLLISAGLIFLHYPQIQNVRTMYVWLKEDATTTLDVHRNQMGEFWAGILPDVNAYRKGVATLNMPPKPSGLCRWCPVRTCEFHPEYEAR